MSIVLKQQCRVVHLIYAAFRLEPIEKYKKSD